MPQKRRRLILLRCCCGNPRCAPSPVSAEPSNDSVSHGLLSRESDLKSEHSQICVDTHVHLNDVFMKIQVSESVPSLSKAWDALSDEEKRCWATLGFNSATWMVQPGSDGTSAWHVAYSRYGTKYYWNSVTGEQTWDKPNEMDDVSLDEAHKGDMCNGEADDDHDSGMHEKRNAFTTDWEYLWPEEQKAATSLGYTEGTWDQSGEPEIPNSEVLRRYMPRFACISSGCDPDGLEHMLMIHRSIPLPPEQIGDVREFDGEYPGLVWVAVGCHPKAAATFSLDPADKAWASLKAFESRLRAVATEMGRRLLAWGEIGLDYSHPYYGGMEKNQKFQQEVFKRQLSIGLELGLPLVVHSREAWSDTISILIANVPSDYPIHLHCFWDDKQAMDELLSAFPRAVLGFSNNLFYADATLEELCRSIPLEHVVLETDAPYLPKTGSTMSHMGDIPSIGQKLADLKGVSFATVMKVVRQNVARIYGI